jgi:hypothetical protein
MSMTINNYIELNNAKIGKNSNRNNKNNTRKLIYQKNIHTEGLDRILFHRTDSVVHSLKSQANTICRNYIDENYIHKVFNNMSFGYYYKDTNNNTVGFCVWRENKNIVYNSKKDYKYITVSLLCAKPNNYKLRKIMLFDIERYCFFRKFNAIQLLPINSALAKFYESNDYKKENYKDQVIMEKVIVPFVINKNIRNGNSKTRRARKVVNSPDKILTN